jgi:hypothetical protein
MPCMLTYKFLNINCFEKRNPGHFFHSKMCVRSLIWVYIRLPFRKSSQNKKILNKYFFLCLIFLFWRLNSGSQTRYKCSTIWATLSAFYCLHFAFEIRSHYVYLCLLSSWDYGYAPPPQFKAISWQIIRWQYVFYLYQFTLITER